MGWMIPAAMIVSSILPALLGKNKGGSGSSKTTTSQPLLTPEQQEAMNMLLNYSKTGRWGSYQAGQKYSGKLGEYGMTEPEMEGQNILSSLLGKDTNIAYNKLGLGEEELKKLYAGDTYNPYNENGLYKGFKRNVLKEASETTDALKRNAAYTGDLYSRDVVNRMGKVQEEAQSSLQDKMAELYNTYTGRKLEMIPTALNADKQAYDIAQNKITTEHGLGLDKIRASQQFGNLSRVLADIEAKEKYAEWLRTRKEVGDTINAAGTILGKTGSINVETGGEEEVSPWAGVLNALMQVGSYGLGKYGESAGWFSA